MSAPTSTSNPPASTSSATLDRLTLARPLPGFLRGVAADRHLADWPPAKARALHRALCGTVPFTTGWYAAQRKAGFARITRVGRTVFVQTRIGGEVGAAEIDVSTADDSTILATVERALWWAVTDGE